MTSEFCRIMLGHPVGQGSGYEWGKGLDVTNDWVQATEVQIEPCLQIFQLFRALWQDSCLAE